MPAHCANAAQKPPYRPYLKTILIIKQTNMLFGAHVSTAGGMENAPLNAKKIGAEIFQFFSRSPRGGQPNHTETMIKKFRVHCQRYHFTDYYIHTPYYINLASANNKIRYGSIAAIHSELAIGTKLGVKYVITHLGSAKDFSRAKAIALVIEAINKIFEQYHGPTQLLIENSAGAGQIIGDTFDELGKVLMKIKNKDVGVCLDTCHAFSSGYDLRHAKQIDSLLKNFERNIGLEKLKLFHFNDSLTELNSHKDRHADIGQGLIGQAAFAAIINHHRLQHLNAILETPALKLSDKKTLNLLKALRH